MLKQIVNKIRRDERRLVMRQLATEIESMSSKMGFRDPIVDKTLQNIASSLRDAERKIE